MPTRQAVFVSPVQRTRSARLAGPCPVRYAPAQWATGDPLLGQDEELVEAATGLASHRALHDDLLHGQGAEQVVAALRNALQQSGPVEGVEHLGAGGPAPAGQGLQGDGLRAGEHLVIDAELRATGPRRRHHPWAGQRQDPAQIGRGDGVEGSTHRPAAHQESVVEGRHHLVQAALLGPQGDRRHRAGKVLGLDAPEMAHGGQGVGEGPDQALREDPCLGKVFG